jgi:hypothetical protein
VVQSCCALTVFIFFTAAGLSALKPSVVTLALVAKELFWAKSLQEKERKE